MGQTPDQIAERIDQSREELKSNLEELEARMKEAADWRAHFRKHPRALAAAAVVGGVLLSTLIGRR